ncbi:chorion class A proteins Ld9-like [Spodoptera frugiperda]|uniref:Chorion class A proteins Ld9-like n=1 Tax=Spodoptera frugiperda TaxID=7108 RepID=A0A9R0E386_SPOFR|nr:chorion class A proteins Ld9-like [Spodoptera frugiperda]
MVRLRLLEGQSVWFRGSGGVNTRPSPALEDLYQGRRNLDQLFIAPALAPAPALLAPAAPCRGALGGALGVGALGLGTFGFAAFGSAYGGTLAPAGAYASATEGNVAVLGELPVSGTTAIGGQVPIMGAVSFGGAVPAAGAVSISGKCLCVCEPVVYC